MLESKLEKMFKQLEDIERKENKNLLGKEQLEAIAEKIFQKFIPEPILSVNIGRRQLFKR